MRDRCPHSCLLFVRSRATGLPIARLRVLVRRMDAGLGVESSAVKSCGDHVGDVLAIELEGAVDNPGTTIGT